MLFSLSRIFAVFAKELQQMKRDKLTFGMMFGIPILQLILFGFAINTNPKHLPTAVSIPTPTPITRALIKGMENSGYFDIKYTLQNPSHSSALLEAGEVIFVLELPEDFTSSLIAGRRPQVLVQADASDPSATSNAITHLDTIFTNALRYDLNRVSSKLQPYLAAYELIVHPKYNPEKITQYNIVPGLLGVILTLTLVMVTGISMTRELESGTMENLLALPAKPYEVMIGKITPYIAVGLVQSMVILLSGYFIFSVPFEGSLLLLALGILVFMMANLALGFTFSTIAKSQLQAMQLTFFFFLPSLLLSGFMFPFKGMPQWAQYLGEVFPLTNFLRIIRGIILKGAAFSSIQTPIIALLIFTLVVSVIAMRRYRQTLD